MIDPTKQGTSSVGRLSTLGEKKRALLIGIYLSSKEKELCNEHLKELENLCYTYGLEVIEKVATPLRKFESATFIGKGKTQEIAQLCKENEIDIVIFDDEIVPHQQRNLEEIFEDVLVIDRIELILGVFEKRARTKEAKIQVELAQLRYQLPRLKKMWTHLSRQRTGGKSGGYLKGEGERQIEIDRRIIKRKISSLQHQLEGIKQHRETQRVARKRSNIPSFAIIGYTNAGKSTLLNTLTHANVLVEDKLFATLDTTTRKYTLPNSQDVLLIDTVGFIRKIPHMLVAAFKSTLEEATEADILIHLVDISKHGADERIQATFDVLEELNAKEKPMIICLNKIDKSEDTKEALKVRLAHPKTIEISAIKGIGIDDLITQMIREVALLRKVMKLKIPQSNYALVTEVMNNGRVISCDYEGNNVILDAEVPIYLEKKLSPYIL